MEVVIEIALAGALAACAVPLSKEIGAVRSQADFERTIAAKNQQIILRSTGGIDVSGRLVYEVLPQNAKRFVIFGLRHSTLQEDVRLWSAAVALLATEPDVHVIGYCDGAACAESVTNANQSLDFTIIAYGEAAAVQAVLNADAQGNLLVSDGRMMPLRQIRWRIPGQVAANIVKEVLR